MGRIKYGSKAAYEAARAASRAEYQAWRREMEMTDEERAKERNKERLEGEEMTHHMVFMAAAIASGADAKKADGVAEASLALLRKRFT